MRKGESKKVKFRYFLFYDWSDFERKMIELCNQPVFNYPHFVPRGIPFEVSITLPKNLSRIKANMKGKELKVKRVDENKCSCVIKAEEDGLQKISFEYDNKKTFILFESMDNLRDLIQARTEYILSRQIILDPKDPKYGGIFIVDNLTEEKIFSSSKVTCQLAGTGEILNSATLVLFKNLAEPNLNEIKKVEITACEWLRKKCMDENFACYLNPLNKMEFKDSDWVYSKDKIDQYVNPNNPKEIGWRRWNAVFTVPIFYLLSLFDNSLLERENRDAYLLWALTLMRWFFSTEPNFGAGLIEFVPEIIRELKKRGFLMESKALEKEWDIFVSRLKEKINKIRDRDKELILDDASLIPCAIPLLLENYLNSAFPLIRMAESFLGYSYDPRIQSAFRTWDDAASGGYYDLGPYPTMPQLWTSIDAYVLVLAYDLTKDEKYIDLAYNTLMTFYEYYNYRYRWNKWGQMKKGQAHACFLPSLDMMTQERYCVDQDMAFIPYMESFGRRCYVTKSGKCINCHREGNKIISWAIYPCEYILDDEGISIKTDKLSAVINFIEKKEGAILVEVENLSNVSLDASIIFSSPKIVKAQNVCLKPRERREILIKLILEK